MSDKENAQNVIEAYRKRQQAARKAPLVVGISALLLIVGAAILIFWLLGSGGPKLSLSIFATDTPTPTNTAIPTATATASPVPTETPTATETPTITLTPTQSGPFVYQVEEGDNLWSIAQQFNVDLLVLITVNNLDPANPTIRVGDKLIVPAPDTRLPTTTPLPTDIRRGTKISYTVLLGDSLLAIANEFNSTVESIKKENNIENENQIYPGQVLTIVVGLVTPVPTKTITPTVVLQVNGTVVPTAITQAAPGGDIPSLTPAP
jgi:LysM repeat protein